MNLTITDQQQVEVYAHVQDAQNADVSLTTPVTWTSSNPAVATVTPTADWAVGRVKGIAGGTAVIHPSYSPAPAIPVEDVQLTVTHVVGPPDHISLTAEDPEPKS
jgi:hypothetical protein